MAPRIPSAAVKGERSCAHEEMAQSINARRILRFMTVGFVVPHLRVKLRNELFQYKRATQGRRNLHIVFDAEYYP